MKEEHELLEEATNLQLEIAQEKKRKRAQFFKGFVTGILCCSLIYFVVLLVGPFVYQALKSDEEKTMLGAELEDEIVEQSKGVILTPDAEVKINQLAHLIRLNYYEDVEDEKLREGIYKGLLEGIGDKYSHYYTQEEYEELMVDATGTYSGIGALLQQDKDSMQVTILHVYENSGAEEAGLREKDVIVKVGDVDATSLELNDLVKHVRGEEGTTVTLTIYRAGEPEYLEFDITRKKIEVPTVYPEMLEGDIGYIQITEFSTGTGGEFSEAVAELEKQGMKKLVVDLRDNPGGMMNAVIEVLDTILPEGLIVYTEDKYGNRQEHQSDAACMDIPMAVLVNRYSASCSEIFAGAIKDYEYGTLIGETTYGKGIVQVIRQLYDGSAVKITTAKYFTPKGNYIHEVGIKPDIEVEYEYLNPEHESYQPMSDTQVLKAVEVLER